MIMGYVKLGYVKIMYISAALYPFSPLFYPRICRLDPGRILPACHKTREKKENIYPGHSLGGIWCGGAFCQRGADEPVRNAQANVYAEEAPPVRGVFSHEADGPRQHKKGQGSG